MSWDVQVFDHQGMAITKSQVSLRPRPSLPYPHEQHATDPQSVTHEHVTNGLYRRRAGSPDPVSGGDWILIVSAAGQSTVVQPLTISQPTGKPLVQKVKPHPRQAVTVSIPNATVVAGKGGPGATFLTALFPASEVDLLTGKDFQTNEDAPGNHAVPSQVAQRMHDLFRPLATNSPQPFIDEGTHVLVYSMKDEWLRVFVRSVDDRWLLIGEDYGIDSTTQVYQRLSSVGLDRPGTVREVTFLAHAYQKGPILVDTYDNQPTWVRERDSRDRDPRTKDFDPPNLTNWPLLPQALHPEAEWRVWGCYSSPRLVALAAFLNARGALAGFRQVVSVSKSGMTTVENVNGPIADQTYMMFLRVKGYAARAASELGPKVNVYGPPPGTWTKYNQQRFWVPWDDPNTNDKPSFDTIKAYLEHRLGGHFQTDGSGYLDYTQVESFRVPPAPMSSEYIRVEERGGEWRVEFFQYPVIELAGRRGPPAITSARVPDVSTLLATLGSGVPVGTPGTVHVLSERGVPRDCFVVAEFRSAIGNGLHVVAMTHRGGVPLLPATEYRPHHRVRPLAATVAVGATLTARYWEVPPGGSVGFALENTADARGLNQEPTPTRFSGEVDLQTTGLTRGARYVVRCYYHGTLFGESQPVVTLT